MRASPFSQENMIAITAEKDGLECITRNHSLTGNARGIITNTSTHASDDHEPQSCRITGHGNPPLKELRPSAVTNK
jgi:hypothetical protein